MKQPSLREGFAVLDARSRCKRVVWAGFRGDRSISPPVFWSVFSFVHVRVISNLWNETFLWLLRTHLSPLKTAVFCFFFFFSATNLPSFKLPSFTIRMVMFSERFRWFGERDSSVKRYRRTRFIFVNKWTLVFNCCSVS